MKLLKWMFLAAMTLVSLLVTILVSNFGFNLMNTPDDVSAIAGFAVIACLFLGNIVYFFVIAKELLNDVENL